MWSLWNHLGEQDLALNHVKRTHCLIVLIMVFICVYLIIRFVARESWGIIHCLLPFTGCFFQLAHMWLIVMTKLSRMTSIEARKIPLIRIREIRLEKAHFGTFITKFTFYFSDWVTKVSCKTESKPIFQLTVNFLFPDQRFQDKSINENMFAKKFCTYCCKQAPSRFSRCFYSNKRVRNNLNK